MGMIFYFCLRNLILTTNISMSTFMSRCTDYCITLPSPHLGSVSGYDTSSTSHIMFTRTNPGLRRHITTGFAVQEILLCDGSSARILCNHAEKNSSRVFLFLILRNVQKWLNSVLRFGEICYRALFLCSSQSYSVTNSTGPHFKTKKCRWGQT